MRQDSHLPEYKQSSMPREVNHPFKASVTLAIVNDVNGSVPSFVVLTSAGMQL